MSTEQLEQIEQLARRAVACKRWRWMDGMLYKQDGVGVRPVIATAPIIQGGGLPDLTDPATLGCLLALVREAWNNPNVTSYRTHPMTQNPPWKVEISMRLFCGDTEVEALVAALEAAR